MPVGYSQTPLGKKLGLKEGQIVFISNAPKHYYGLFEDWPENLTYLEKPQPSSVDFIHLFCINGDVLYAEAERCKKALKKTGVLWVSWPKSSSTLHTDLKREAIREHMLQLGLIDIKVAAIDKDWSGLKFMYRIKDR